MTTRKEINKYIETLSNNMGHKDRVKRFCELNPKWNPIKHKWENIKE